MNEYQKAWIKLKQWIATEKTSFGRTQLLDKMMKLEFEMVLDKMMELEFEMVKEDDQDKKE